MHHWEFIIWEFIDFVTSSKNILASEIYCISWDICVPVETRYFLIFQNILGATKNFSIAGTFFQILLSTIFYKKSGTFNEASLSWTSLTWNIFSKKRCVLCRDKSQVQKSCDIIVCFFVLSKKQTKIQKQPGS